MPLTLTWSAATSLPVDGESLRPDALTGLSAGEVARVRLPVGKGSAGADIGLAMRRGLIAVLGPVGDGLGRAMIAGSIFAFGPVGRAPGSGMRRGTLALLGPEPPEIPPTFRPSGRVRPPFMSLYL